MLNESELNEDRGRWYGPGFCPHIGDPVIAMGVTFAGEQSQTQRPANITTPCTRKRDSEAQRKIAIAAFVNPVKERVMTNEALTALLEVAEKAQTGSKDPAVAFHVYLTDFNEKFDPTTCAELVREVLRLRETLTKTDNSPQAQQTEAPERIWIDASGKDSSFWNDNGDAIGTIEYVRADLPRAAADSFSTEMVEAVAQPWICVEEKPCSEAVPVHWQEMITALAAMRAPRAETGLSVEAALRDALEDANGLCRSAMAIAKRRGIQTNWTAFEDQLKDSLERQHKVMYGEREVKGGESS